VVVGIEADVGERDDWNEWWPRPVSHLPTEELTFGWNTDIRSK
jgi:hypothetical protein